MAVNHSVWIEILSSSENQRVTRMLHLHLVFSEIKSRKSTRFIVCRPVGGLVPVAFDTPPTPNDVVEHVKRSNQGVLALGLHDVWTSADARCFRQRYEVDLNVAVRTNNRSLGTFDANVECFEQSIPWVFRKFADSHWLKRRTRNVFCCGVAFQYKPTAVH